MKKQFAKNASLLWFGYILLLLSAFSLYGSFLSLLGFVALILGYVLRRRARSAGYEADAAHAAWQINTVWLTLLLFMLMLIALFIFFGWMGSDPAIQARLDELSAGSLPPMEMLKQFWAIPGSKALVGVLFSFSLLSLVWPLKRVLHGMLALHSGIEPLKLGSSRWLALVLAALLQLVLPFILL